MAVEALNMQRLRAAVNDDQGYTPGATVYGVADREHMEGTSDHNPDDTAGVRTPQTDLDSKAEWRALDVMVRGPMTFAKADALAKHLVSCSTCRSRLMNVIWNRRIASRSWGWTWKPYSGSNPHTDHPHIAGLAAQDENGADWPHVRNLGKVEEDVSLDADDKVWIVNTINAKVWGYPFEPGTSMLHKMSTLFAVTNATTAKVSAHADAVSSGDAALKAKLEELDAEATANAEAAAAADAADAQRDADLYNLVQLGQSGEVDANEVIRLIGERLSASAEPVEPPAA